MSKQKNLLQQMTAFVFCRKVNDRPAPERINERENDVDDCWWTIERTHPRLRVNILSSSHTHTRTSRIYEQYAHYHNHPHEHNTKQSK